MTASPTFCAAGPPERRHDRDLHQLRSRSLFEPKSGARLPQSAEGAAQVVARDARERVAALMTRGRLPRLSGLG